MTRKNPNQVTVYLTDEAVANLDKLTARDGSPSKAIQNALAAAAKIN